MPSKIGFIGVGKLGTPMAVNVVRAGYELIVCDNRQEAVGEVAAAGATIASSPREVGESAEIVQIAVRNDHQVEEILLGKAGLLEKMQPDSVMIIHSTVLPRTIRKIADVAKSRRVGLIDAAISGGERVARAANLTYMVGGDKPIVDRCRPLLGVSAKHIFHLGELGAGLATKLAHQLVFCLNVISGYEGFQLVQADYAFRDGAELGCR